MVNDSRRINVWILAAADFSGSTSGVSVALGHVVQVAGFGRFLGQLQEWSETFGLSYFGIARGARTGGASTYPHVLAYVEGDFDAATVRQSLLALEYERREAAGLAYYAVPEGFNRLSNPASRLALNSMDHVFIGEGVLMAAPGADMLADALADALKVKAGAAPSLADDPRSWVSPGPWGIPERGR